jgi:hypothetical protein
MQAAKGSEAGPSRISRVLWKEIKQGDRRKFSATANDEPSAGGGARDLRFRGGEHLGDIFKAMFPRESSVSRRRDGMRSVVKRHAGDFCWFEKSADSQNSKHSQVAYVEPPTTARPGEWRITRVHTYDVLREGLPPQPSDGRLLLLLIQTEGDEIWPVFITETSLRTETGWHESFRRHVLACLDRPARADRTIFGYFEADTGRQYCNV